MAKEIKRTKGNVTMFIRFDKIVEYLNACRYPKTTREICDYLNDEAMTQCTMRTLGRDLDALEEMGYVETEKVLHRSESSHHVHQARKWKRSNKIGLWGTGKTDE